MEATFATWKFVIPLKLFLTMLIYDNDKSQIGQIAKKNI